MSAARTHRPGLPARSLRRLGLALLASSLVAAGCATPIGVNRVDRLEVQRQLAANAISAGAPSVASMQVLRRTGLTETWKTDPEEALRVLHGRLDAHSDRTLFALAELSYLHGIESKDRRYHFAAAVYAWAILFPGEGAAPRSAPWDPRSRTVYDLYNRALAEAFTDAKTGELRFEPGRYELPFGSLDVEVAPLPSWGGYRLDRFVDTAHFEVRGLSNRYRYPGVGASLSASLASVPDPNAPAFHHRLPPRAQVPTSAFLRLDDPRAQLTGGEDVALHGRLEVYDRDAARAVTVDGREVPLEYDTTTPLAYALETSALWDFELSGFFSANLQPLARAVRPAGLGTDQATDGLYLLQVYHPGRIPLVLVHGTASSPARWAELANELDNDPILADRIQIWIFIYNTGNPILYSGALLREALTNTVQELDPEGRDPALRDMVVMGHSQGGLLTKLTAIDSGDRFWTRVSTVPIDDIKTDDATRALLRRTMFVKPVPSVRRVIFMSTPHRGSFLARLAPARWVADFIKLPGSLTQSHVGVMTQNEGALTSARLERLPTSVDNMTPGNGFLETLVSIPIAPGVHAHSIIPVKDDRPLEDEDDGVVKYTSAHLDGVDSEKVVRHSGHSTQGNPETIEEVRRILRLHVAELSAAAGASR